MGGWFVWALLVRPVHLALAARHWQQVPCEIVESELTHHGRGGNGVHLRFTYRWQERVWTSDRYDGYPRGSSYGGARDAVDDHPVGSFATCLVDPADPAEAILDPSLHGESLWSLLGLIFLGLGLLVLAGIPAILFPRGGTTGGAAAPSTARRDDAAEDAPLDAGSPPRT
jgi:hypothetical protein